MENLTKEQKQTVLYGAPEDAAYYSVYYDPNNPRYYKFNERGQAFEFVQKNICDKKKSWVEVAGIIFDPKCINDLRDEMQDSDGYGDPTEEDFAKIRALRGYLGFVDGDMQSCGVVAAKAYDRIVELESKLDAVGAKRDNLDYSVYESYIGCLLDPVLVSVVNSEGGDQERVEWQNGDECVYKGAGAVFIGYHPSHPVMVIDSDEFGLGMVPIEAMGSEGLSKPESPEQKTEREREEKAKALYAIAGDGITNPPWSMLKKSCKEYFYKLVDAGVKPPSDES